MDVKRLPPTATAHHLSPTLPLANGPSDQRDSV